MKPETCRKENELMPDGTELTLNPEELRFIEDTLRSRKSLDLDQGAMVISLLHRGYNITDIAAMTGLESTLVQEWKTLWEEQGIAGFANLKLMELEPRLRALVPADLYADMWVNPSAATLDRVFGHLRTLLKILYDYVPQQVFGASNQPGKLRFEWMEGTLLFTDLAGFTPMMEANFAYGKSGAASILKILNLYFAAMLEIISKSGGSLLEYTGDAMLVLFPADPRREDTHRAIRAGLRMQLAMQEFSECATEQGSFPLKMRVGIHAGRFLTMDIGTPRRMEHILLGQDVRKTKETETNGEVGRVCLTVEAWEHMKHKAQSSVDDFVYTPHREGYLLVKDNLTRTRLGEYEIPLVQSRRFKTPIILERTLQAYITQIEEITQQLETLASYLPAPVLSLLVENADRRQIPPDFSVPTVVFVNLLGLTGVVDEANNNDLAQLAAVFSRVFGQIEAIVDRKGGILKKVTYHLTGSDIMIFFGVPSGHTNDPERAMHAALAIREVINAAPPLEINHTTIKPACQIGLSRGPIFAAEIGEPRGRREYNVLGDDVNIAARLMGYPNHTNAILLTKNVYDEVKHIFRCHPVGTLQLKGKMEAIPVFALDSLFEA